MNKNKIIIRAACMVILISMLSSCSIWDEASYLYYNHDFQYEDQYTTVLADVSKLDKGEKSIAVTEGVYDYTTIKFDGIKKDATGYEYDLRFADISEYDLSVIENYNYIRYTSTTVWPENIPFDIDPDYILEFNKNPGLKINELHEKGIDGTGVGIAIIDAALYLDHDEYKDNLVWYERIHCGDYAAGMHGAAVASIAVGKNTGVAPGAKLYYIASTFGHVSEAGYEQDGSITADCIYRVVEINRHLSDDEKIRVISISNSYNRGDAGYQDITNAIREAEKQGIFVITVNPDMYYSTFKANIATRDYMSDPDNPYSYGVSGYHRRNFEENPESSSNYLNDYILFPAGSRTYASFTGSSDYEISYLGGMSWISPWCAGLYALCCQVKPDITPKEFIDAVNSTGIQSKVIYNEKPYFCGKMINPTGVVEYIQNMENNKQ